MISTSVCQCACAHMNDVLSLLFAAYNTTGEQSDSNNNSKKQASKTSDSSKSRSTSGTSNPVGWVKDVLAESNAQFMYHGEQLLQHCLCIT
jgi:hypothetical protein